MAQDKDGSLSLDEWLTMYKEDKERRHKEMDFDDEFDVSPRYV